jgi:hypothetical protein
MVKHALAAIAVAVTVASCGGKATSDASRRRSTRPTEASATPTTTDVADRYNPTHDSNLCVRVFDDGTVALTIIEPVPPGMPPNPAFADQPTVPGLPLGKCG